MLSARSRIVVTGAMAVATMTTGGVVAVAAGAPSSHVRSPQPAQVLRVAHYFTTDSYVSCKNGGCLTNTTDHVVTFRMPSVSKPAPFTLSVSFSGRVAGAGHFGISANVSGPGENPKLRPARRPLAATTGPSSATVQFLGTGLRAGKTYTVEVEAYRADDKHNPIPDGRIVVKNMTVELLAALHD